MAKSIRNSPNAAVTLSILDRLIDLDPKSPTAEAPLSRADSVRALKSGLRRDLEWLLNSRRTAETPSTVLPEVETSIYSYGLPDFSNYSLASPKDQTRLIRVLQNTIKTFEPRLSNIKVIPIEITTTGTRAMRLRVEGLLMMDPAPEHVSFDTTLQLTTGDFRVENDNA